MSNGLSPRTTALLVALAFGLSFAGQALLGGGSPAAEPVAKKRTAGLVAEAPGAAPDLRLVAGATVPALREPKRPPKRKVRARKPKRSVRKVVRVAPRSTPAPVTRAPTVQPTPAATPRYVPPAPRHITPAPRPKPPAPKPTPATPPPPSGEFDTSGEP